MNLYAITALSAALVASVLALAREMRLRRALAKLLSLILSRWRPNENKSRIHRPGGTRPDDDRL